MSYKDRKSSWKLKTNQFILQEEGANKIKVSHNKGTQLDRKSDKQVSSP